jgi:hypothetical protein
MAVAAISTVAAVDSTVAADMVAATGKFQS